MTFNEALKDRALIAIVAVLTALVPLNAAAQRGPVACARLARARNFDSVATSTAACRQLAAFVNDSLETLDRLHAEPLSIEADPRALQSRRAGDAAAVQGEALPTVQPTALAGGSLAALGSGGGADGIVAISLNPLGLFSQRSTVGDAMRARIADVTLLAPIGGDTTASDDIRYLGLRVRLNVISIRGAKVLDEAESLFRDQGVATARYNDSLTAILAKAPDVAACVTALLADEERDDEKVRDGCGSDYDVAAAGTVARRFRDYVANIRDRLDSRFLGLDIRYDRGDPTLGAVPGLDGTFLFAGLAGGMTAPNRGLDYPTYGIRGRIGVQYISLRPDTTVSTGTIGRSFDAALAFEASYPGAFRPLRLSGGLEHRSGGGLGDALDDATNRGGTQWRISIDVPLTAANGITVTYATPLQGHGKPSLNVGFNWQLLLKELSGAPAP